VSTPRLPPSFRRTTLLVSFNGPPPTEIYTLSLHDALPIWQARQVIQTQIERHGRLPTTRRACRCAASGGGTAPRATPAPRRCPRSEEHTSELQSHLNLVCRLLLEKKKQTQKST